VQGYLIPVRFLTSHPFINIVISAFQAPNKDDNCYRLLHEILMIEISSVKIDSFDRTLVLSFDYVFIFPVSNLHFLDLIYLQATLSIVV